MLRSKFCRAVAATWLVSACGDSDTPPRDSSAAPPRVEIVEERDGLWLVEDARARRRLTAMRVAGFDYDSLAAKQREGEVILYWAAAAAPSPDRRLVAYASNREAVAADTSGQSIWLVDVATGDERALLTVPGHSYRPIGWLADDVLFIGDEPGVWTIDPVSRERRRIASGTWIAVASDGSALAVADDVPDAPRVRVITADGELHVPPAPDGAVYLPQAAFDSSANRLELEATPDSGYTRVRYTFDLATRRLERLE